MVELVELEGLLMVGGSVVFFVGDDLLFDVADQLSLSTHITVY